MSDAHTRRSNPLVAAILLCIGCGDSEALRHQFAVSVQNEQVRACDLIFKIGPVEVRSIDFSSATLGVHFRRGPRLAVASVAATDRPFPSDFLKIELGGGSLQLTEAVCYDGTGRILETAGVVVR